MFRAMIVEDDEFIREGLKVLVQRADPDISQIECFGSSHEALARVEQQAFDLLLTDIEMPVLNGLGLIEALRGPLPELPCVIITGYDRFDYAREALRLDALDYLLKPVDEVELASVLCRVRTYVKERRISEDELIHLSGEMVSCACHHPERFGQEIARLRAMAASGQVGAMELDMLAATLSRQLELDISHRGIWMQLTEMANRLAVQKGHRFPLTLAADIAAYIEANFSENLTVGGLADHFHVTAAYLGQVYLKVYNQSISTALHIARIAHAKEWLREPSLSIVQVSERCGYHSIDHFYRQFRKLAGETPAAYRQRIRCKASNAHCASSVERRATHLR